MSDKFHGVCASLLLAAALLAQEPGAPTFDANAKLVLVPFHVQRGKYFAADLQPADVILREDGHPRPFTTFEGPNTPHPLPLELILLFDTTPKVPVKENRLLSALELDPKADYEFLDNWDEAITREALQKNGMDIHLAVYHYAGQQLERLCAASSDPRDIVRAFHALLDPIPQGKGELRLLPGDRVSSFVTSKTGWLNESIVDTLKDAAASPVPARRVLIVFTSGSSGTLSKSPGSYIIVEPALAMSIPVDPVIMDMDKQEQHVTGNRPGLGGALATADAPKSSADPLSGKPGEMGLTWYKALLPWITKAGELTGGEAFVPHHLDREALAGILSVVRDATMSQYVVGFSPVAAARPKKHSLTVALTSKSKGKLVGGQKNGVTY